MTVKAWLESRLAARWYSDQPPPSLLRPLAALFGRVARARRHSLSQSAEKLPVPVIVVGNISVGGTGKTPFTIWLVERLREWGWRPGIISRGHGGHAPLYPFRVAADSNPAHTGDEPLMMMRRLLCPVYVGADRVAAARALLAAADVNVLVSDDGLQHYRLARDLEICVVDGVRRLGNGALLPAGPLREPATRLQQVHLTVVNGGDWRPVGTNLTAMGLAPAAARPLAGGAGRALGDFAGQRVHALAGIGHPERFFDMLRGLGLQVTPHAFPDHYHFQRGDLEFGDGAPVLMTEKDAVKCSRYAGPQHWVVAVEARISEVDTALVRKLTDALKPA